MKPRGTVGASDVAALFHEHPYMSYYALYARECGLLAHEADDKTERQQIGIDLEEPVLRIWAKREGLTVGHCTESTRRDDGLSATPDGYVFDGQVIVATVDVKTVQPHERKNWLDGIPKNYLWQLQQQMLVCGVSHGYLVALFGVDSIESTRIEADPEAHAQIIEGAAKFWKQVRGELPPPEPDDHKATLAALMGQRRESKTFDLSAPNIAAMAHEIDAELQAANAAKSEAEKRLRAAKSKMLRLIGDCDRGIFSDGSGYEIRTVSKKEFTVKASTSRQLKRFANKDTEEGEEE
jgi:predicted phage-related endonuclease